MTTEDERLHDAVSADNVRRLLDGRLTDPMPGTLAERATVAIRREAVQCYAQGMNDAARLIEKVRTS